MESFWILKNCLFCKRTLAFLLNLTKIRDDIFRQGRGEGAIASMIPGQRSRYHVESISTTFVSSWHIFHESFQIFFLTFHPLEGSKSHLGSYGWTGFSWKNYIFTRFQADIPFWNIFQDFGAFVQTPPPWFSAKILVSCFFHYSWYLDKKLILWKDIMTMLIVSF